jgi:TRAP-type mannitol/chloroaromatic compound transport system permease small subunit
LERLVGVIDRFNECIGRVCAWLLLPMVGLAFGVVALRYIAQVGYPWLSEAFVWLNGAIVLLASADVLRTDQHVRVDLFFKRLSPRGRAAVDFFGVWLLLMPMVGVIGYLAWPTARFSVAIFERSPTPDGLPLLWVMKLLVLAFCALVALQGLAVSLRAGHTLRASKEAA